MFSQAARTELEHRERMKKKEYQVKQLRDQLAERDRRLQDASTRINALETTLVSYSLTSNTSDFCFLTVRSIINWALISMVKKAVQL